MKHILSEKLGRVRGALVAVGVISCIVNLLMLTGPLFMLQVYDRVLTSRSVPTLVALVVLIFGLYAMMGLFDFLRSRVLSRVSQWLDDQLSPLAFRSWMTRQQSGALSGYRPVADVGTVRNFFSSPAITALFDLPWLPVFLAIVFMLHVELGLLATGGAIVVLVIAIFNERLSANAHEEASRADLVEARFAEQAQRNADSVLAMGMLRHTQESWKAKRDESLFFLQRGSERTEYFAAASKSFRLLLQSLILGYGAYLAIHQEITAGMIIAASILAGRALAPLDQIIGGWRMLKSARISYKRLSDYLDRNVVAGPEPVQLPVPKGHLRVSQLRKIAPRLKPGMDVRTILTGIDFELQPGEGLGVIGPSASGKSSLARLLVGLWLPDQGSVRVDGATYEQWDPEQIGKHVGYLPQQVEMLSGTIAQNIARFDPKANDADIVAAAKMAGVHDMILSFPEGYSTNVDAAESPLTGGQRQRVGLARAVYRTPALVVLDEPNSNLDAEGDQALANAIVALREAGSTVVVMAHRPSAIAAVNKVLMLNNGQMVEFGDKAEVLRKVTRAA